MEAEHRQECLCHKRKEAAGEDACGDGKSACATKEKKSQAKTLAVMDLNGEGPKAKGQRLEASG